MKSIIIKGFTWIAFSQGFAQVQQIVFGAILARLILPSDFGLMAIVSTFFSFIALFQMQSFGTALIQKQDVSETDKNSLLWLNLVISVILVFIIIAIAPLVAKFYNNYQIIPIIRLLAITLIISSLNIIHTSLLTKALNFKILSLANVISSFFGNICAVILALNGFEVWSLVWQILIQQTISLVFFWLIIDWRPRFLFSFDSINNIFSFSFYLQFANVINYVHRNLDDILIAKFLGSQQLGYYNRAYKLMQLPQKNLRNIIGNILFPAFAKFPDDHTKIQLIFLQVTQYTALITIPLGTILLIIAPELIIFLYGPRWQPTIFLFQVLVLIGVKQSFTFFGPIFLSQGRTDVQFYLRLSLLPVMAIALAIGIQWNIKGVAIAYAIANILGTIPAHYTGLRLIGLRLTTYYRVFLPIIFSGSIMGLILWRTRLYFVSIEASNLQILLICTLIGLIVYLGLILFVSPSIIMEIWNLFKKRNNNTKK